MPQASPEMICILRTSDVMRRMREVAAGERRKCERLAQDHSGYCRLRRRPATKMPELLCCGNIWQTAAHCKAISRSCDERARVLAMLGREAPELNAVAGA